jgi:hypothetical protein
MAVDVTKVRVAITGAISKGALGATAPTSEASSLTGFTDVGGISEEGVALALNDEGDKTPIKLWQQGLTARTLRQVSEDSPTLTFAMAETSKSTIETYFGVTVTQTVSNGTFKFKTGTRTASSYVLDVIDGTELIRCYVPRGVVSSVEEITLANSDAILYGVTLDLEYDQTLDANFQTWMTALKS